MRRSHEDHRHPDGALGRCRFPRRRRSRDKESFPDRLLAMMRNKFGGHAVKKR